jgi:hypothetical protein
VPLNLQWLILHWLVLKWFTLLIYRPLRPFLSPKVAIYNLLLMYWLVSQELVNKSNERISDLLAPH